MSFSNPAFLFFFLPVALLAYYLAAPRFKNGIALAASLVFFSWGQLVYLPLMAIIILVNFFLGQAIERARINAEQAGLEAPIGQARRRLFWGIFFNLAILIFFKALTTYGADWLNSILPGSAAEPAARSLLPLGISYISFQVISYLVDVYNELVDSEKSFLRFSLYVMLFPKIIVGPITRYRDLAGQLENRAVTGEAAAAGARRFILGLAKKALIADTIAQIVNPAFGLDTPSFSTGIAWLVLVGYALQLYFDFSGFTDMAIGLGQMLGFRFVENFNYPYISKSISEFWRRWHISLSSWFRDYVFYPLEFTRRKPSLSRQQMHILIVFLLTGLWHGLTLNFVIWGLIHGLALALEMSVFGRLLKKAWAPLQHLYALAVVLLAWVFFRSPDPSYAFQLLGRLAGSQQGAALLPYSITQPLPIVNNSVWLALLLGIVFSLPVLPALRKGWGGLTARFPALSFPGILTSDLLLLGLLAGSVAALVSSSYAASIYGGF